MAKPNKIFVCSKCDAQFPKWLGRCSECGSWGTVQETVKKKETRSKLDKARAVSLENLSSDKNKALPRIKSGLLEWDNILGGGLVPGSLTLLGGDPGIGKSTLALQLAAAIKDSVYVSGEESNAQVAQRLTRIDSQVAVPFLASTSLEDIIASLVKQKPPLAIIDSIQTISCEDVAGEPGNVAQVRACTTQLLEIAKKNNIAIVIVGHVTKDGQVAGPKTLEHLVDTVLYLEGDKYQQYRLLRAVKNRFGQTGEVGVWEMTNSGLQPVNNPSKIFIQHQKVQSGSIVTAIIEGSRVFLVEVQALVNKTSYGYPRRVTSGFNSQRLEIILAVLARKTKLPLNNYDVYINVAGGLNLTEPAADLAVAAAILSAYYDKALPKDSLVFGEVGLGGELRTVNKTKERIKEAIKLGIKKIILPDFEATVKKSTISLVKLKDIDQLIKSFK